MAASSYRSGTQYAEAAPNIVGHCGEPDLQTSVGQSDPPHPAQPIASFGGTKNLLDPSPYTAHLPIVRLETIKRRLAAPCACLHGEWYAAAGEDQLLTVSAGEGAIAIHVAWLRWQHGRQQGGIVHVGSGNLHGLDQNRVLIRGNMRLVAMHWLAAAMTRPPRLIIVSNAG